MQLWAKEPDLAEHHAHRPLGWYQHAHRLQGPAGRTREVENQPFQVLGSGRDWICGRKMRLRKEKPLCVHIICNKSKQICKHLPETTGKKREHYFFFSNIPATTNLKCAKCQSCCLFIDISFRINVIIKRLFIYFSHSESYFSTRSHTLQKQVFLSPHQNLIIVRPGEKYFQAPQLGWMSSKSWFTWDSVDMQHFCTTSPVM